MSGSRRTSEDAEDKVFNSEDVKGLESKNEGEGGSKPKRRSLACIRCRTRHIRCPGGDPCKKCQMAKTKCEYVEADKKIVVSMKYLSKLHDDIARLKKDNAMLRNQVKEGDGRGKADDFPQQESFSIHPIETNPSAPVFRNLDLDQHKGESDSLGEIIEPSLDKHGRMVQSTTGEKAYVGSSSMTLFGLEIQNMVPSFQNRLATSPSDITTPNGSPDAFVGNSPYSNQASPNNGSDHVPTEILAKEGNAYKITLAKSGTRPAISIDFILPSYSYAMLLVDTFINYNDGCFYFFNEGLVKRFLMNLYSGKISENKKILRRNSPHNSNESKAKEHEDDVILETIWFCKILLIFATGEMYLGTESEVHIKKTKALDKARFESRKSRKGRTTEKSHNVLPGSGFFYEASELFTGLFASGAIDNITKDGGIEVLLLYAFYLQVADCTNASYFYFGLALRSSLILGWHVDADKENLNRFELEHRRRLWWTVYMYERMLSSKAGLPLSFADDSVSTELPVDFNMSLEDFPKNEWDVRGYFIFPSAEYINNCVTITQINAVILASLYTKQPTVNILPVVSDLVQKLINWRNMLPEFLKVDFSTDDYKVSRLVVNLMTEYFQGMNLAVRPLLFHFATKKLKELQTQSSANKYVDLTKFSKNILTLLNASFQASINTIKCIWALFPDNMVALFGWMDREYLFTSASTLILFNSSFGVHEATRDHLDHALTIFNKMKELGNNPAAIRRAQLLQLIKVLDFNGSMRNLLLKHREDDSASLDQEKFNTEMKENDLLFNNHDIHKDNTNATDDHIASLNSDINDAYSSLGSLYRSQSQTVRPHHLGGFDFPTESTSSKLQNSVNVYTNNDLTGIEGLTYLDEESKLWNEITHDAVWLNAPGGKPNGAPTSTFSGEEFINKVSQGNNSGFNNPDHLYGDAKASTNHNQNNADTRHQIQNRQQNTSTNHDHYQNQNESNQNEMSHDEIRNLDQIFNLHDFQNGSNGQIGGYSEIVNREFQDLMMQ